MSDFTDLTVLFFVVFYEFGFGFGLRVGICLPFLLPKLERILAPDIIFSTECPTVLTVLICLVFVCLFVRLGFGYGLVLVTVWFWSP